MENALWNGQLLIASEIAKNYYYEKEIRKASGRKELCCPDPECHNPILRYCHGEKKDAFFAHLNNEHCDYADFDRQDTQIIRNIRIAIYEQLKKMGFKVSSEVKILDHHYSHLIIYMDDGSKIAIEIGTQRESANRVDMLTDTYQDKGIAVKWIVIDNTDTSVQENKTYFLKRFLLNESNNKDLLVVSWDAKTVTQYKVDPNKYEYDGSIITSNNYPEIYADQGTIDQLTIDGGELTLVDCMNRYDNWLLQKRSAFEKKVLKLEEEKQREEERQSLEKESKEHSHYIQENITASVNTAFYASLEYEAAKDSYNLCDEELLRLIGQQEKTAFYMGKRWIKCEKCGYIGPDNDFITYGGRNHLNLGTCKNCSESNRNSSNK